MRTNYIIYLPVLLFAFLSANAVNQPFHAEFWEQSLQQESYQLSSKTPAFLKPEPTSNWAKSVLDTLTLKEKIGQLFMVAAYSNRDEKHIAALEHQIKEYGIGGLIFFQGGPGREAAMQNRLQAHSKIPLLIGIDAEWGLNMRLDSTYGFQRQMTMGATQNPILVQEVGNEIGRQCKELGIHINFAPVCDVNSNASNPVINSRSFGEDRFWVAKLSTAYARGLESAGVMACAKHFPGHGDTDSDSHKTLPTVGQTIERLDSVELYPFKSLFDYGISSVMVAHLNIPAMDASGVPSTLSPKVVAGWLKDSLKYEGLVVTDALNMRGVADAFAPGITDLKALQAGADLLLFPMDVPKAIAEIEAAVKAGNLDEKRINEACLKILKAKERFINGAGNAIFPTDSSITLNQKNVDVLRQKIAESSITLVKNQDDVLPLNPFSDKQLVVSVGKMAASFKNAVQRVAPVPTSYSETASFAGITKQIKDKETVVLAFGGSNYKRSNNYGLDKEAIDLISMVSATKKTILVWFGNPYALSAISDELLDNLSGIVLAYEAVEEQKTATAKALFGVNGFKGRLPVSISKKLKVGMGLVAHELIFPEPAIPERQGMSGEKLNLIDEFIEQEIQGKSTPGCRILVMRKGKAVYNKSFGHYTYANKIPVNKNTIYDLASLTKMLGTGLATMKLYEEGVLDIEKTLGDYLAFIPKNSPYARLKLRDVMLHQAQLSPWIPYYKDFLEPDSVTINLFALQQDAKYPVRVANNYFVNDQTKEWIWNRILQEPLRTRKDYKYSDLGFYFLKEIIETITNKGLDSYLTEQFFAPMQLKSMRYQPLNSFPTEMIAPTEYDITWRKQLIQGDVHDQGAALLGGVGGHAGLFATAEDVAAIMQMLLDGGTFNGERFLNTKTIKYFTSTQEKDPKDNRRGLIFDKPVRDGGPGPTFDGISFNSFGHSGFTGTLAWADPDEEIVYVFLSNRIYPSSENKKLIRNNVRSKIQEMVYQAILEPNTAALKP